MLNDPISDMLSRINNTINAGILRLSFNQVKSRLQFVKFLKMRVT